MGKNSKSRRDAKKKKADGNARQPDPFSCPPKTNRHSITITGNGLLNVISCEVQVEQINPDGSFSPPTKPPIRAVWDTGATHSTVSQAVVKSHGLIQTGMCMAHTANGAAPVGTYLINLYLPNRVGIPNLRVNDMKTMPGTDMLIGMDVMSIGEFVITNTGGKTVASFSVPSMMRIDFVKWKPRGNYLCTCGSGKKFAECCGEPFF